MTGKIACAVLGAGVLSALGQLPVYRTLVMSAQKMTDAAAKGEVLSFLMTLSVYVTGFAVALFAYLDEPKNTKRRFLFVLILLTVSAIAATANAKDLPALIVCTETVTLLSCLLASLDDTKRGIVAALKSYLLSMPGMALIITGAALAAFYCGGTSFEHIRTAVQNGNQGVGLAAALLLCGYAMRAGILPFHGNLPELYSSTRGAVAAFLACAGMRTAGIYALLILTPLFMGFKSGAVNNTLIGFGVCSLAAAALMAITKHDMNKLLTYAGISQTGYILIAAGIATPLALAGAVFQLFAETAAETVLYLNSAVIEKQTGTRDIADLGGLRRKMPWTAGTTLTAALSLAGLPPLAGFWGQFVIIFALWKHGGGLYIAGTFLGLVLTFAYIMSAYRKIFHGNTPFTLENATEPRGGLLIPSIVISAILIIMGLYFPQIFTQLMEPGVKAFL